jgi:hypothetical protein
MKTNKRPISMRCTQEQFESIKDRIPLSIGSDVFKFANQPNSYLTNNYYGMDLVRYTTAYQLNEREVYETFNADIFLEACGVDVEKKVVVFGGVPMCGEDVDNFIKNYLKEKVWKASELQYRITGSKKWYDYPFEQEFRIKPQPDYTAEIEALQQKAKENGMKVTINFEKL